MFRMFGASCYNCIGASCYNCNNAQAVYTDGPASELFVPMAQPASCLLTMNNKQHLFNHDV